MYGLFVKRHAEAAAINHRISVFYVHACNELPHLHQTEVKKGFISEYYYYYRKSSTGIGILNTLINGWRFLRGHWALRKKISKPDLIHVHILTRLGVLAYIANKASNIPYVVTEHWSRYQKGNRGYSGVLRKFLTRLVTSNASALTTVTLNLKEAMANHGIKNKNHYVLNNVVDIKTFFPENKAYKKSEKIKLVHVSCFDDEPKNISGLLKCIKELSKKRNDFVVEMVGTGKDHSKMMHLSKELEFEDSQVIFTGQLEGIELGNAVRSANILMLFSNYENLPVVINEAFCCGVPVISTDVGGIKEVVNTSNGRLVKKGDIDQFVYELEYMMDHLSEYNQKQIYEEAVAQYSVVAISNKLDEIYSKNSFN